MWLEQFSVVVWGLYYKENPMSEFLLEKIFWYILKLAGGCATSQWEARIKKIQVFLLQTCGHLVIRTSQNKLLQ